MKKVLVGCISIFVFVTAVSLAPAYADRGKQCPVGGYGGGGLDEKFFKKAHFILENKKELGLTEEKAQEIKNLKVETKKALIKQEAEIDAIAVDVKSKLYDNPIDVQSVNALIDQKYELKKAKTKSSVEALAKLKGSLTQEQYDKMGELWKSSEKKGKKGRD